jgi:3-oxoacyl-[acyl-carrier protein] reductase
MKNQGAPSAAAWQPTSREEFTVMSWAGTHTAIMTGANHGIGAATAALLGERGCAVLCAFLRVNDPLDPGTPQAYRDGRVQDAESVVGLIRAAGTSSAGSHAGAS